MVLATSHLCTLWDLCGPRMVMSDSFQPLSLGHPICNPETGKGSALALLPCCSVTTIFCSVNAYGMAQLLKIGTERVKKEGFTVPI